MEPPPCSQMPISRTASQASTTNPFHHGPSQVKISRKQEARRTPEVPLVPPAFSRLFQLSPGKQVWTRLKWHKHSCLCVFRSQENRPPPHSQPRVRRAAPAFVPCSAGILPALLN